jgi:hypothetical protein
MLYFFSLNKKAINLFRKSTKIISVSVAVIKNFAAVKGPPTGRSFW